MSAIPSRNRYTPKTRGTDITALIPDFPFDYGNFLDVAKNRGTALFDIPAASKGKKVLVVGAGASGMAAAYELLRMGLHPVVVEASDRIGGRLNSHRLGDVSNQSIAELGAMRFPVSGKTGMHYFGKLGMLSNSAPFPNPGSESAVSTVVDYEGEITYYENRGEGVSNPFPPPKEYLDLEDDLFGPNGFLNEDPINYDEFQRALQAGNTNWEEIKEIWDALLATHKWDNLSFYSALVEVAKWDTKKINLFGQIGFGTGGWNTDYPNAFLEVLRVLYTGLDVDHQLMLDGADALPQGLMNKSPSELGDASDPVTMNATVKELSEAILGIYFSSNPSVTQKEVRHLHRNMAENTLTASITDTTSGRHQDIVFDAVIYTPHVRILDKFRRYGTPEQYKQTTALFGARTWEAIEYTHYMQSAKIFMATREAFWKERDPLDGKQKMSTTLSDRLTRGTYLVDYANSHGDDKGSGIFLSYTWNDDSLKFLGDRENENGLLVHANMCRQVLKDIYPKIDLADYVVSGSSGEVEINWENEPLYLGAFKMNLPGQYEYQRILFSQFMMGIKEGNPDPMILAGDDVSWVAGWVEGALTTSINAVNKVAVVFGGGDFADNEGPIARWDDLKPVAI